MIIVVVGEGNVYGTCKRKTREDIKAMGQNKNFSQTEGKMAGTASSRGKRPVRNRKVHNAVNIILY